MILAISELRVLSPRSRANAGGERRAPAVLNCRTASSPSKGNPTPSPMLSRACRDATRLTGSRRRLPSRFGALSAPQQMSASSAREREAWRPPDTG